MVGYKYIIILHQIHTQVYVQGECGCLWWNVDEWQGRGVIDGFKVDSKLVSTAAKHCPAVHTVQLIEISTSLMCIQQKPWVASHISQYSLITHSLLKPTIECSSDEHILQHIYIYINIANAQEHIREQLYIPSYYPFIGSAATILPLTTNRDMQH